MSETNTATIPFDAPATPAKTPVKAASKRTTKPNKAKAKPVKAKAKAKETKGKTKAAGETVICGPQRRILAVLAKSDKELTGDQLTARAKLASRAWLSEYLGTKESENDGFIMKAGQRTNVRKLVPSGYVRAVDFDVNGDGKIKDRRYEITASGRKALERLVKADAK